MRLTHSNEYYCETWSVENERMPFEGRHRYRKELRQRCKDAGVKTDLKTRDLKKAQAHIDKLNEICPGEWMLTTGCSIGIGL